MKSEYFYSSLIIFQDQNVFFISVKEARIVSRNVVMQEFKNTGSEVSSEDGEEETNKPGPIDRPHTFRAAALSPRLSIRVFLSETALFSFIADVFSSFFSAPCCG